MKFVDITNQRFSRLLVLRRGPNDKNGRAQWICLCDCNPNKEVLIPSGAIRKKKNPQKSCGCLYRETRHLCGTKNLIDRTGERCGSLTVIKRMGTTKWGKPVWHCSCDCGGTVDMPTTYLTQRYWPTCGSDVHPVGIWYPPTPDPYPEEAAKIVSKYIHTVKWYSDKGWAEDIAINALMRSAWIVCYRSQTRNPIPDEAAYIKKALRFSKQKFHRQKNNERYGRPLVRMERTLKIGLKMTNPTSHEAVARAETQPEGLLLQKKFSFKRR
jgi:hypothetical protein